MERRSLHSQGRRGKRKNIQTSAGARRSGRRRRSFTVENNWLRRRVLEKKNPSRPHICWGSLFCTNLTQPTSALDVASQDMTIETLLVLRKKTDLSILLVTHNMEVARRLADEIGVMYQGRIIESGLPEEIWNDPKEDYTKKLIAAIPQPVKLVLDEG